MESGPAKFICYKSALTDPGSIAFQLGTGDWPLKGFVVRQGDHVFAYLNRCPHAGHPLNWQPDKFLTADGTRLLCSSHGALFAIDTGHCVAGPCVGRSLIELAIEVKGDEVLLVDDPNVLASRLA
jgi:nitrite reductase/ring-hydroxylating ferredoxin subunit